MHLEKNNGLNSDCKRALSNNVKARQVIKRLYFSTRVTLPKVESQGYGYEDLG